MILANRPSNPSSLPPKRSKKEGAALNKTKHPKLKPVTSSLVSCLLKGVGQKFTIRQKAAFPVFCVIWLIYGRNVRADHKHLVTLWEREKRLWPSRCRVHPLKQGDAKKGSSSFVPAGNFTVYKHSTFMVERPNKKLFEDFAQSISPVVSIVLPHNDSPVIAWERALTGDWGAHHIGMTKPSICSWKLIPEWNCRPPIPSLTLKTQFY